MFNIAGYQEVGIFRCLLEQLQLLSH
jgi:hypothetical protein